MVPRFAAGFLAFATAASCAAGAAAWHPVPGAPDVQVDLASLRQDRARTTVWLRWWGLGPMRGAAAAAAGPRVHRTSAHAELDCARRRWRILEADGYDSRGTPVFMSSVPGPAAPVEGADLAWTFDAVCEAARSAARAG